MSLLRPIVIKEHKPSENAVQALDEQSLTNVANCGVHFAAHFSTQYKTFTSWLFF